MSETLVHIKNLKIESSTLTKDYLRMEIKRYMN